MFAFRTKKAALAFIGGLSKPSKMPCKGWSLPAFRCKIGTKLRAVINSVCSKCYAHKGMYVFPKVRACLERRFGILERALSDEMFREMFRAAFVRLLRDEEFFRWLDSGDIQSVAHLLLMADIARETGLGRESLYKALAPEGNPEFATILKVVKALGLRLRATKGQP